MYNNNIYEDDDDDDDDDDVREPTGDLLIVRFEVTRAAHRVKNVFIHCDSGNNNNTLPSTIKHSYASKISPTHLRNIRKAIAPSSSHIRFRYRGYLRLVYTA